MNPLNKSPIYANGSKCVIFLKVSGKISIGINTLLIISIGALKNDNTPNAISLELKIPPKNIPKAIIKERITVEIKNVSIILWKFIYSKTKPIKKNIDI